MALPKSRLFRWSLVVLVAACVVALHPVWLGGLGGYLVRAGDPVKADIAVVLAGDASGNRILKAAELARRGYVPKVLVSGPAGLYGYYECELAIPFAVKRGFPEEWFDCLRINAHSTREEAEMVLAELRRRGVRTFLLVTSDYHTRRAGGVYRALAKDREFHVVAAPDEFFQADGWWRSRQGQKQFLFEWLKTIAYWVGL